MSPSSSPHSTTSSTTSSSTCNIASAAIGPCINLQKSCQSPRLLPAASLAYASRSVLTDPFTYADALLYGPDLGCTKLRNELAAWLTDFYNPESEPIKMENLCITGGASQNLAAICQKFTDPVYTRAVWLVTPSSRHRCSIFEDNGLEGKLRFVPEDEEGIDIGVLESRISREEAQATSAVNIRPVFKSPRNYPKIYKHLIYVMPTFKNPTSSTISLSRRKALIRLARRFDALIIADDAFDFLRYNTSTLPLPRIVDLDRTLPGGSFDFYGNAVSNASFSVLVAPGARVGWLEGTRTFVKTLSEVGSTQAGGAPSQLVSTFIWNLLTTGTLQSHLDNVLIPAYSRRYTAVTAAIATHLRPLGVTARRGEGGWFVWLHLPVWCDSGRLARRCREEANLFVGHDELYQMGTGDGRDGKRDGKGGWLRISLAWEEDGRLEEGVRRIAEVIAKVRGEGKSSTRHHIDVRDLLG